MMNNKKIIETKKAPQAIGVYSQGIEYNNLVFTSGQIPLTPEGKLIKDDFKTESIQVIKNIESILNVAGSNLSNIIKITVYLTDLTLFPKLNEVFKQFFNNNPPARSVVEIKGLPMGARIEMEAIALKK